MKEKFDIEIRDISSIKPYDKNPRINDDAVDAVAASLKEFGFRQPIVVDADGVIVCGHTRFKAAIKLGLAKVPVHVACDLTPEQIRAYRIADNKTSDLSDWDFDILPIELTELQQAGFDLGSIGFDEDELAERAATLRPQPRPAPALSTVAGTDTPQAEYEAMVLKAKQHILDGDIFQGVLSRTLTEPCPAEPLDVYRQLRKLNPSPYMFYINSPSTVLMGASPELNLRVSGGKERTVEIRPIAGTKPRGRVDGKIDPDTDMRYEAELKLDRKELAEHMMLVDLARNDIARVAQPGTRIVNEMLITERYESVMHLVSNVKGKLRKDLDALSAYLATMNMGTLTGAPKIEAMKIIRRLEKNKRGYYGGAVMYLTVDGQFDSCITIRSLQIRDHTAYIRAGAGIVHDSNPTAEYHETEHKAQSCLKAIRAAAAAARNQMNY